MLYRIFPSKDTAITNSQVDRVMMTGSNVGASEILDLFKRAGISGTIGVASTSSLSRILMQFDLADFTSFTGSYGAFSSVSYYLKLKHATTRETLPASFDIDIYPLTVPWDEGKGIDTDEFLDSGYANWVKPRADLTWTSGSSFSTAYSASYHFDTGYEDIDVDVSSIVRAWLDGSIQNYGAVIKLTSSIESNSVYSDYYLKSFYGRTSNFNDRRPYLEARYNDVVSDDRKTMTWSQSGTLYMYNKVNGQFTNLPYSQFSVAIADSSGTLFYVTGSYTGTPGIYSASLALVSASYSGSVFYDRWSASGNSYMTGTFYLSDSSPQYDNTQKFLSVNIKNLKDEYETNEIVRLNVFMRTKEYNPAIVLSSSLETRPFIAKKCYYAIENDSTRERVIQFGTGSLEHTRLSYDSGGNYLLFPMKNLNVGNVYRILLMVVEDGQRQIYDNGFKFKVV